MRVATWIVLPLLWLLLQAAPVSWQAAVFAEAGRAADIEADDTDDPDDEEEDAAESALVEGEMALDAGRWQAAVVAFKKALKEDAAGDAAACGLAEAYAQTGKYDRALKTLEKCTKDREKQKLDPSRAILVAQGRLSFVLGGYKETLAASQSLLELDPGDIDGLLLQAKVQYETGDYEDGEKTLDAMRASVLARKGTALKRRDDGRRHSDLADLWCAAGEGYFLLNRLHEANDCWANALEADEFHLRSNAWMARLYLEQNHDVSALNNYALPTLKHNPNAAELHYRAALCYFFRWRSGDGKAELDKALEINPDDPEVLAYRAAWRIGNDQYDEGREDYEAALKVNPNHIPSLAAKALHGVTLGLTDLVDEAEKAALSINPKPARFYEILADGMADRFRYVEAMPFYKKALQANPAHWTAYRGQGLAALNMGDDKLGKESLETALREDPLRNNLQTVNLLTLLDSYDRYERVESEDGRFRLLVHRSESKVMIDYYFDILNQAWVAQTEKYGFTPRTPLTVEAFPQHADFEVRTVGITGLPALGACFGQLITLDSPSARQPGTYNWASTVRHEMDHVFQIQISNGQVPRWLAEGLSSYEEKRARPEWERHMEDLLFRHYHLKDIPSVTRFNEWFRDGSKVMFAYYLANVMCEFLDKRMGGFKVIARMLAEFGKKKTPDQVFAECLEMAPEEFDKKFLAYVEERISHLKMVEFVPPDEMDELLFLAEDGEASDAQLVRLALGYLQKGATFDAGLWLGLAGKKGADKRLDRTGALYEYIKGMLVMNDDDLPRERRSRQAQEHLERAVGRGLEDFRTFMILAQFAMQAREVETGLHYLQEAQRAWPESPQPRASLFQIYLQLGRQDDAIAAAEGWVKVDESNLDTRLWLIENVYRKKRDWEAMAEMSLQAIYVQPLDPKIHEMRAYALRKLERWAEAAAEYEMVRRLASGTPDEARTAEVNALLDIAATWLNGGDPEKARAALEEAKALDPENPRIKTIEDELDDNPGEEIEEEYSIPPAGDGWFLPAGQ